MVKRIISCYHIQFLASSAATPSEYQSVQVTSEIGQRQRRQASVSGLTKLRFRPATLQTNPALSPRLRHYSWWHSVCGVERISTVATAKITRGLSHDDPPPSTWCRWNTSRYAVKPMRHYWCCSRYSGPEYPLLQ
jgi:hypothetical protein